jgi:adenylyltransferase/sulfurtransferase
MLPDFGPEGQNALEASKVACIGAGGLGSSSLLYLAAAGVGTIRIIDDDVVEISNLQRQIIHGTKELGRRKVESAAERLKDVNPLIEIDPIFARLNGENGLDLLKGFDIVIDGTDNIPARYLLNDICEILGIPWIHASVFRYEGQLTVFNLEGSANYRDLFPNPPPPESIPSCSEAGVLGALPGILGTMQAMEAIKIIADVGSPLSERLMILDTRTMDSKILNYSKDESRVRATKLDRQNEYIDSGCDVQEDSDMQSMTVIILQELMNNENGPFLLDVRRPNEEAICSIPGTDLRVEHTQILQHLDSIPKDRGVVVYCRSGIRSMSAIAALAANGWDFEQLWNLDGGIHAWSREIDPTMPRY